MTIGKTLTLFAAGVAVAAFTISVAKENNVGSIIKEKLESEKAEVAKVAESYILQGASIEDIQAKLRDVGASASQNFPIINAVAAKLTPDQLTAVKASGNLRVQEDRTVMTMDDDDDDDGYYAQELIESLNNSIAEITRSSEVHDDLGQMGSAQIGVIIVDSGVNLNGSSSKSLRKNSKGQRKDAEPYDVIAKSRNRFYHSDENGHGTHVASIIGNSLNDSSGQSNGIAPDAQILSVKAFDKHGRGSYSTVLAALDWIYQKADLTTFRVLNLSIGAPVASHYWNDPINQAVMQLWRAGVVVVTSAGNNGEDLGISVPGNNPYVITVGAMADNNTPLDFSDDRIATFSSRGPTYEGFIKPDIIAPGTRIAVQMGNNGLRAKGLRKHKSNANYYEMSGTSQAAAVVSGIAALILAEHPYLSANDVKCRIMSSARPATEGSKLAFSPFAQGMGLIDAYAAVTSNQTGCANVGLNINADLAGQLHFFGPVMKNQSGEFYIQSPDGAMLTEGAHWGKAMSTEGSHWGEDVATEGALWGSDVGLEGSHWGSNSLLKGTHWGSSMAIEGAHWGEGMATEGAHWGEGMATEGAHWGEGMAIESVHWGSQELKKRIDGDLSTPGENGPNGG